MELIIASLREDTDTVKRLARILDSVYTSITVAILDKPVEPPPGSYDPGRGQYRSEQVLAAAAGLKEALGVDALLVVAGVDAYADQLNFVFGEALLGLGVAVVYTPRLRPEYYGLPPNHAIFMTRLLKEAMHELGHAFGLRHCTNRLCVMSFSNSILEVDLKKPAYCTSCAQELRSRGIIVSEQYVLS